MMGMTSETKTRFIGFCPICEGDFKLADNKLVHHGYRRPRCGHIVGDCFAVFREPYELSFQVCEEWKAGQETKKANLETYLGRLRRNEVTRLSESFPNWRSGKIETVEYIAGVTDRYTFMRMLESKIHQTEGEIAGCRSEISRMGRYIENWTLKPVRTIEEMVEKERQAREARKAERDAKRAEKAAKRAAIDAKNKARKEEHQALIAKYREIFTTLAEQEVTPTVKNQAQALWRDMCKARNKKEYLYFYDKSLECDSVLVKLGLAEIKTYPGDTRTYTNYAQDTGLLY